MGRREKEAAAWAGELAVCAGVCDGKGQCCGDCLRGAAGVGLGEVRDGPGQSAETGDRA